MRLNKSLEATPNGAPQLYVGLKIMRKETKQTVGFITGALCSTAASWFASLFVFQKFILRGQQSSMGFEYIPVIFGTPVLAFAVFAVLFAGLRKFNLSSRLTVSGVAPILGCIGAVFALYKLVFNY